MIKFIFNLLFVALTLNVFGASPIVIFEDDNAKFFTVSLSEFSGDVEIDIFNWQGELVFEKDFTTVGINTKTFDATSLPNGKYVFIISDETKEKATPFEILAGKVDFRTTMTTMTFVPTIQHVGDQIVVNAMVGSDSEVVVSLEDNINTQVFSESYKSDVTFGKVYNVSKLRTGFYVIHVAMNGKEYSKSITIE